MITNNITIENARIGFRNFSGKPSQYNPAGKRNFCVFLDKEMAELLQTDGWNIKWLKPRDEGDEEQAFLSVSVSFENMPPKILLITSRGKTVLDEENVNLLDWAEIKEIDLIIRPYNWTIQEGTRNEKRGVKPYIKSMYVTLSEDEFEAKYYDLPSDNVDPVGH